MDEERPDRQAPQVRDVAQAAGRDGDVARQRVPQQFFFLLLAEDVALAWRGYWRQSLLRSVEAEQAEADLTLALAEIQRAHSAEPSPNSGPERLTVDLLERSGWHYSVASTPPWRDLYVWKTEQRARYSVELTDLTVPVEVVFMDDFVVQG